MELLFLRFYCWTLIRLSRHTESGFAGDIDAIEIFWIDWLIVVHKQCSMEAVSEPCLSAVKCWTVAWWVGGRWALRAGFFGCYAGWVYRSQLILPRQWVYCWWSWQWISAYGHQHGSHEGWTRAEPHLASLDHRVAQMRHLLAAFHCFVPFIGCQWGLEDCLRSICWPIEPCMKNSLFIFTPCLPHHLHPVHCDQTMIIVCQSLGSKSTQV